MPTQAPAGAVGVAARRTADTTGLRGAVLPRPYVMPAATFVDTARRTVRLPGDARSPVTLVFFGYTHCPDVCGTVLADLAQALRRLAPALRTHVEVLFVTTDPARDTPDAIRRYLDRFDPTFVGLTGTPAEVGRTAAALGVPLDGTRKLPGGGYEVGHGAQVTAFTADADGRRLGRVRWQPDTPIADLDHDLTQLVRDRAPEGGGPR